MVQQKMREEGVRILASTRAEKVSVVNGEKHVFTGSETIVADEILVATGRSPSVESLNLEAAGVDYDKKALK